jgi:predicted phosphodiesterase
MKVILTGDWHIGAATTSVPDIKRIAKKYWEPFPVILMGDIADYGYFKGMQFNQALHPQEQVNEVQEICSSLNVVAYTLGNHEARVYEATGLNPYAPFLHMKPSNFFRAGSKLIYFNHGKSTAQNIFLEQTHLLAWIRADVIALGHNHALASIPYITSEGKIVHLVRTGSFIGYANYAKRAHLPPGLRGWVTYDTEKHSIRKWFLDTYGKVREI